MRLLVFALALLTFGPMAFAQQPAEYTPSPENLAARQAFQDDKFGVFIHWGVYSVLARGEWVMNNEKISITDYEPVAKQFNPTKFDADAWCKLFKQAGAKYITITSKHHDGFAMWDSKSSDWDIVDRTPYGKDILKQLAEACQKNGLKLYFYHSQLDWHHPDYYPRGRTGGASGRPDAGDFPKYVDYMNGQLSELLGGDYGPIAGIWFDGWWDQKAKDLVPGSTTDPQASVVDWRLGETYKLIHDLQPGCLVGANHHVEPFAGEDFQMFEKDLPGGNSTGFSEDSVISRLPLETCDTINGSWGFNADDKSYKSVDKLIGYLINAAGRNANLLLNIGPKPDGTIDAESAARLEGIGKWLATHGDSIYGTRGGPVAPQAWGVTTHREGKVYLHVLDHTAADGEGWLTLAGTETLTGSAVANLNAGSVSEWRREPGAPLQIKCDWSKAGVDEVFVLTP